MDQVKFPEDSLKKLKWYGMPTKMLLGSFLNTLTHSRHGPTLYRSLHFRNIVQSPISVDDFSFM